MGTDLCWGGGGLGGTLGGIVSHTATHRRLFVVIVSSCTGRGSTRRRHAGDNSVALHRGSELCSRGRSGSSRGGFGWNDLAHRCGLFVEKSGQRTGAAYSRTKQYKMKGELTIKNDHGRIYS